ncbi:hypothetical protein CFter6_1096 [Collimonas fungivorans]|uniref:Uncharacterized protein n=1 Tax=Collimonas fungivorans TaxID=158899 RepID=A0A127P852_9BURK|nr:hypothetical protein CFter6_1096 [Collimonas fungivorans]
MHQIDNLQGIIQKSFSDLKYAAKKKLMRRYRFLAEIDTAAP